MTELDDGLLGTEVHLLAQREQLADHLLRRMEIPLVHNLSISSSMAENSFRGEFTKKESKKNNV